MFINTSSTPQLELCTAANTWTAVGGSGIFTVYNAPLVVCQGGTADYSVRLGQQRDHHQPMQFDWSFGFYGGSGSPALRSIWGFAVQFVRRAIEPDAAGCHRQRFSRGPPPRTPLFGRRRLAASPETGRRLTAARKIRERRRPSPRPPLTRPSQFLMSSVSTSGCNANDQMYLVLARSGTYASSYFITSIEVRAIRTLP